MNSKKRRSVTWGLTMSLPGRAAAKKARPVSLHGRSKRWLGAHYLASLKAIHTVPDAASRTRGTPAASTRPTVSPLPRYWNPRYVLQTT
jgi:hypothetical protein